MKLLFLFPGNEVSGTRVSSDDYAADLNSLQKIVQDIYAGFEVKPQVIAPGGFFDPDWFTAFIQKTPKSLQVVTHHIYSLGSGKISISKHQIKNII